MGNIKKVLEKKWHLKYIARIERLHTTIRILTAIYLLLLIRSIKSEGERNFKGIVKESPTVERVHFKRVL